MAWTAAEIYGTAPSLQPQPAVAASGTPASPAVGGGPSRSQRTEPRPTGPGASPVLVLVALLGVAVLLTQLSVRGSVSIGD